MDNFLRVGKVLRHWLQKWNVFHRPGAPGQHEKTKERSTPSFFPKSWYLKCGNQKQIDAVKTISNYFSKTLVPGLELFGYLGMITLVPHFLFQYVLWLLAADPVVTRRRKGLSAPTGLADASISAPLLWHRDRNAIALGGL